MSLTGRFVRIRTDLTPVARHYCPGSCAPFTGQKATYAGRIGIVVGQIQAEHLVEVLFFDDTKANNADHYFWFHRLWVTLLSNDDIIDLDADFRANLQSTCQRVHPDITVVGNVVVDSTTAIAAAAAANFKTTIDQIRAHLADADRIVAALE